MKFLSKTLITIILVFAFLVNLYSYYFYDDFSASSGNWIYELKYARALGVWNATENETVGVSGGRLTFSGTGYIAEYSTYLFGFGAILTNIRYSASEDKPFGFEVTRVNQRIDYHDDTSNPESGRMKAELLFYLAQYNQDVLNNVNGARFTNFVTFVEFARAQLDSEPDTQPFSFFSDNESGSREDRFDLSAVLRPNDSSTINLVNLLEWCYDDMWGKGTRNPNGTANNFSINNNVIKFRVTTDGRNAYLYVNPNPTGAASVQLRDGSSGSFSNEFYLIATVPISFTDNIMPMIAIANNRPDNETLSATFDDFTIRSIASNVVAEISPQIVRAGNSVNIHGVVRPIFSTNQEAGIEEVYIRLPEGYTWTDEMTNNFVIKFIDSTTGGVVSSFGKMNGDVNPSSGNVALSIKEAGRTLKVRFNASSDSSYDVFHPDKFGGVANANQRAIYFIISNFVTLAAADNIGKDFEIFVNNEKYADTGWSRVATTGKMKARAGNAINMALFSLPDGDTLTFKTCYDPVGLAGLRAGNVLEGNKIYEGDSGVEFLYDFSTANATVNNAYISRVEITVPAGFTIDPTYLVSDKIGASTNIYLTNSGSKIVVNYEGAGTVLPPVSGGDTLHFKILSTTNFSGTNEVRVEWPVVCYSSIAGTVSSNMLTNALYPIQSVLVRKKPPIGEAYVTVRMLRNTYYSNQISIVVKNMGASGNKIEMVRIALDPILTNFIDIQSGIPSTNAIYTENGTNFLFIDYSASSTNIINGGNDTISFKAFANIDALTNKNIDVVFKVEADNRNGDGWVNIPAGSDGLTVTYYTPFAEVVGYIYSPGNEGGASPPPYNHILYTDVDFPTNVVLYVRNDGEERNRILQLRIELPPEITNVANVISLLQGGSSTNYRLDVTNIMEIFYTNSGVSFDPSEEDRISFVIMDSVEDPANLTIKLYAKNTTNYKEGGAWIPDNLVLNFIYPPALGKAYAEAVGGFIDSSTNESTIKVYITNEGRSGNIIKSARVTFDTNVFTNVVFVSSMVGGLSGGFNNGVIEITYTNGIFRGGTIDTITFRAYDKIEAGSLTTTIGVSISNQRWWTNLAAPSGKTLDIEVIPPPTLYSYKVEPKVIYNVVNYFTNTNTVVISLSNRGWGSNYLDKVKVTIPSFLVNKVLVVSNELLGITNSQTGLKISNGTIWLEYDLANTNLVPNKLDRLFVDVNVDFTNITNTVWFVEAANNSTNVDGSHNFTNNGLMIGGGTNYVYFVEIPLSYTTNTNIIASTISNYLSFFVLNGSEFDNGRPLRKVRLGLPYPFSGISNISSGGVSSLVYQSSGTNFVEIDYGGTGLIPGAQDVISFWAYDTWESGEISKSISFEVDYNDGVGFRPGGIKPGNSLTINFINPSAVAGGYTTPREVSYDYEYYDYTLFIKNLGETGNDVLRVIVEPPFFITNINNVSSSRGGNYEISNNNILIVYYTNVGNLVSGETDSITFRAYDNVEYPDATNGAWKVYADNTLNGAGMSQLSVYGTGSFSLELKNPGYNSVVYIEASNSINPYEKNKIYNTIETNVLYFYLNNTGTLGNYIENLRVDIPEIGIVYLTNYLEVANTASDSTIAISNGSIWVTYNTPLTYNQSDMLTIKILDLIDHYEKNVSWSAQVIYNTSGGKYRNTSVKPGKSLTLSYISPLPSGLFAISPSEVYYNLKHFTNTIFISNTGEGTSDWDLVEITLPKEFTNGFNPSWISGSSATNVVYNPSLGKIIFYYSNFAVGYGESINIPVSNNAISNALVYFGVGVRNYVNETSISGNGEFLLSTIPSYFVTPNSIDTTTMTNSFTIEVYNTINGDTGIKKLRLHFPQEFKEVISIDSGLLTNESLCVSGSVNSLLIDYTKEDKEISKGDVKDIINIVLRDDLEIGSVLRHLTIEGDGGYGFVPLDVKQPGTNLLSFIMPQAYALGNISPLNIYLGTLTNTITIMISNAGENSNNITYSRISVPSGFNGVRNVVSSYGGKVSISNQTIYVDYTTNYLGVNKVDVIRFDISNTVAFTTNLTFDVGVANLTNNITFYSVSGEDGRKLGINLILPPCVVEASFYGDNRLYLIETNSTLIYRIRNLDPYGMKLTNVSIYLSTNTNIFEYFNLVSSNADSIQILNGTNIIISYQGKALGYQEYDDISINVRYRFSNTFRVDLTTRAVLSKDNPPDVTNVIARPSSGSENILWITNGGWGIVEGSVFPALHRVTVKLYREGDMSVATNVNGEQLITSTELTNGYYVLRRILPGNYKLEFSKEGVYKTDSTNIVVLADKILTLPPFRLRNAPLIAGANQVQQVTCYDDMESYILFPVGSIQEDFSVDILKLPFSEEQRRNMENNSLIRKPNYSTNMYGFRLDIYNLKDISIDGATLNNDAILYLHYDENEVISRGWNEDSLAIYYWDTIGDFSKWIRIGGVVDKESNFVSAKASYLHGFYAVMGKEGESGGVIRNVVVRPRVFTPKDKGKYFGSVRLTFEFNGRYDKYEVRIYDLKGNLVKLFERNGEYVQGEVSWDGTDNEGYPVKTGVYIYQIMAGNEKYSGTVIIAR